MRNGGKKREKFRKWKDRKFLPPSFSFFSSFFLLPISVARCARSQKKSRITLLLLLLRKNEPRDKKKNLQRKNMPITRRNFFYAHIKFPPKKGTQNWILTNRIDRLKMCFSLLQTFFFFRHMREESVVGGGGGRGRGGHIFFWNMRGRRGREDEEK